MHVMIDALAVTSGKNCTRQVEVHPPDGDLSVLEGQIRGSLTADYGVGFGETCAIRVHGEVGTDGGVYPIDRIPTPQIFPYK